ncbi:MAG: hypothetical protein IJR47_00875 [Clostridia bacterium]|nr:hypothetical protein [Clostridia bacterium]
MTDGILKNIGNIVKYAAPIIAVLALGAIIGFINKEAKAKKEKIAIYGESNFCVLKVNTFIVAFLAFLSTVFFSLAAYIFGDAIVYFNITGIIMPFLFFVIPSLYICACCYAALMWKVEICGDKITYRTIFGKVFHYTFNDITRCVFNANYKQDYEIKEFDGVKVYLKGGKAFLISPSFVKWDSFKKQLENKGIAIQDAYKTGEKFTDEDHFIIERNKEFLPLIIFCVGGIFLVLILCIVDNPGMLFDFDGLMVLMLLALMIAGGIFFILLNIKFKLIIDGEDITYMSLFGARKYNFSDITKCKYLASRGGGYSFIIYSEDKKIFYIDGVDGGCGEFMEKLKKRGVPFEYKDILDFLNRI